MRNKNQLRFQVLFINCLTTNKFPNAILTYIKLRHDDFDIKIWR